LSGLLKTFSSSLFLWHKIPIRRWIESNSWWLSCRCFCIRPSGSLMRTRIPERLTACSVLSVSLDVLEMVGFVMQYRKRSGSPHPWKRYCLLQSIVSLFQLQVSIIARFSDRAVVLQQVKILQICHKRLWRRRW
jgi:hypothetical protein